MKIYTKRGDEGFTDLFGGLRVSKADPRVLAYGKVDAANSAIGFAASDPSLPEDLREPLFNIMSDLFDLGAELATAPKDEAQQKLSQRLDSAVDDRRITQLEESVDRAEAELAPLQTFVLPTGSELSARFHLARTALRQAEQEVVALVHAGAQLRPQVLQYLNRLSDLLFVWARLANHRAGVGDVAWRARK